MDQQDLFFASFLSNQRANEIAGQNARATEWSGLVSGFMAQGHSPQSAEMLAREYLTQKRLEREQRQAELDVRPPTLGDNVAFIGILLLIAFLVYCFVTS